jgi:hypothetical protein
VRVMTARERVVADAAGNGELRPYNISLRVVR